MFPARARANAVRNKILAARAADGIQHMADAITRSVVVAEEKFRCMAEAIQKSTITAEQFSRAFKGTSNAFKDFNPACPPEIFDKEKE